MSGSRTSCIAQCVRQCYIPGLDPQIYHGPYACVHPTVQEDNFIPTLSVWETLAVTTRLRLPATVDSSMRTALMDATLSDMGLQKVKHSQVRLLFFCDCLWLDNSRDSFLCVLARAALQCCTLASAQSHMLKKGLALDGLVQLVLHQC